MILVTRFLIEIQVLCHSTITNGHKQRNDEDAIITFGKRRDTNHNSNINVNVNENIDNGMMHSQRRTITTIDRERGSSEGGRSAGSSNSNVNVNKNYNLK